MTIRHGFTFIALVACTALANADELLMKNGSRLVGTLVSSSESEVIFDTPFAGEITLKQENIETIITTEDVTLLMQDGRVFRNKKIIEQEGELIVIDQNESPVEFAVTDIQFVTLSPGVWAKATNGSGRSTRRSNRSAATVIPMKLI